MSDSIQLILIVLDLRMPGMGGMDVMRAISQLSPDTEIILLTAHGSMETAVDALRFRIHDYLIKPVSPNQILASIRRGLSRKALKKERRKNGISGSVEVSPSLFTFEDGTVLDFNRRIIEQDWRINPVDSGGRGLTKGSCREPRKGVFSSRVGIINPGI